MWGYQLLTILLIFSLPIFPEQFGDDRIKHLIMLFSIYLLPIFFPALLADIKRGFIPTLCFLMFLIPLTIITFFSIDKGKSNIQLHLFYSYFFIFVSIPVIFRSLRSKELLVACYLLLVTCLSFISLYNVLIRHYVSRQSLSFLWVYFGHNHLSALLIFAIPFCLYSLSIHWKNSKVRILTLAICILLLISLLFTFSIGAMIMLAFSIVTVWFIFNKTLSLGKSFLIVFFITIIFSLSSLFVFSMNKGIKDLNFRKNPTTNIAGRFTYWQKAFDNFVQKPFTGSGLNTFRIVNKNSKNFSAYTHNFFIEMLTDSGIFGFVTSAGLIGAVFWHGYNTIKTTIYKRERLFYLSLIIGLLSSTLLASIDFDWHLPTVFLFFWIFAGLLRKNVN